jgi:hypothetical protein
MKIHLAAFVALAVGFALPAFSQQKETVDLPIVEQLDALTQKFMDAIDSNDAAAIATVYAEDAVVGHTGTDLRSGGHSEVLCRTFLLADPATCGYVQANTYMRHVDYSARTPRPYR